MDTSNTTATSTPTSTEHALPHNTDTHACDWPLILNSIATGESLTPSLVTDAMKAIMQGQASDAQIAAFIYGMRVKGIEAAELDAAASAMSSFATTIHIDDAINAVDIVGTGGDGAHTVNISTMASLVVASMGVTTIKHGNRAASSKSGGADMLEALGFNLEQTPDEAAQMAREHHFAFLFARTYHPAMRFAAPIRSQLRVPTLFNLLGPMTNPAKPRHGLIGCAFGESVETMAQAFARRGNEVLVVRGKDGLDEISVAAPTDCFVVTNGTVTRETINPEEIGYDLFPLDSLKGGSPEFNADVARDLFQGEASPAVEAAVVMNAAAALVSVRGCQGLPLNQALIREGENVREALESGAPQTLVEALSRS